MLLSHNGYVAMSRRLGSVSMVTSARLGCGSVTVEASPVRSITSGGDGAVGFSLWRL